MRGCSVCYIHALLCEELKSRYNAILPQQLYPLIADVQGLSSPSARTLVSIRACVKCRLQEADRNVFLMGIFPYHIFVGGKEKV